MALDFDTSREREKEKKSHRPRFTRDTRNGTVERTNP